MANAVHANYARIGFTVLLGVAALIGTLVYIGGVGDDEGVFFVETYYDKPVSGLSVGSTVNLRGVKIGEVKEIDFVGNRYDVSGYDLGKIYILLAIRHKSLGSGDDKQFEEIVRRMISRGLRATVTASGITGLSRIELDFRRNADPEPEPKWKPNHIYVPSAVSLMESFSDSATKVMNQINRMDLNVAWSNINASIQSLARATESAQVLLENNQADLERIVEDFSQTSASVRMLSDELRRNPSLLIRDRKLEALPETENLR